MRIVLVTPEETIATISSDPQDNRFLECAVTGHVNFCDNNATDKKRT